MKLRVTGSKSPREGYRMIYFRGSDGKSYITHVDYRYGNSSRWKNLRRGDVVHGAQVLRGNIINADSIITKEGGERAAETKPV